MEKITVTHPRKPTPLAIARLFPFTEKRIEKVKEPLCNHVPIKIGSGIFPKKNRKSSISRKNSIPTTILTLQRIVTISPRSPLALPESKWMVMPIPENRGIMETRETKKAERKSVEGMITRCVYNCRKYRG